MDNRGGDIEIELLRIYNKGIKFVGSESMKDLLLKIGKLIENEIDDVQKIEYVDGEMGQMFYICFKDGKRVLLSLIDSKL